MKESNTVISWRFKVGGSLGGDDDGLVESQLNVEWRAHASTHVRSTLATYCSW